MNKSKVNKIGKSIRHALRESSSIHSDLIEDLQNYRSSFKEDLSAVFQKLSFISHDVRGDSITSFRIKRIESILSKIKREPTMALGNMGDIAGCRVILYSEDALRKLITSIDATFGIEKSNDYLKSPKKDGYDGYHIYIKSPINEHRLIEIQLRLIRTHKWSSLVEIIDILYDLKLKEGQSHPDLQEFLFLQSLDQNSLSIDNMKRIIDIDSKYEVYNRLLQVFLQNRTHFRLNWIDISSLSNNTHFIFEVDKTKKSSIKSFNLYDDAEKAYFEMFKNNNDSNFVLAFIEKANYRKICIAYASYMLIKHDYLSEWNKRVVSIAELSEASSEDLKLFNDYVRRNLDDRISIISSEIEDVRTYLNSVNTEDDIKTGLTEWLDELYDEASELKTILQRVNEATKVKAKRSFLDRILGRSIKKT